MEENFCKRWQTDGLWMGIINVGSVTSNLSSNLNHLTLTHEMVKTSAPTPTFPRLCHSRNGGLLSGVIHTPAGGKANGMENISLPPLPPKKNPMKSIKTLNLTHTHIQHSTNT